MLFRSTGILTFANDNSVYIKTGFTTFQSTSTTYPNATSSSGFGYTGTSYNLPTDIGPVIATAGSYNRISQNGTTYYWYVDKNLSSGNNFVTREFTSSFVYTGQQIGYGPGFSGQNRNAICETQTANTIGTINSNNQYWIGTSGQWTVPHATSCIGGATNGTDYMWLDSGGTVYKSDSSGGNTVHLSNVSGIAIAYTDGYYYLIDSNNQLTRFTNAGNIDTSFSSTISGFSIANNQNMVASLTNTGALLFGGAATTSILYEFAPGFSYGNSTAYTDPVTGDPIFIRLK